MSRIEEVVQAAVARRILEFRAAGDEFVYGQAVAVYAFFTEIIIWTAFSTWKVWVSSSMAFIKSQISPKIRMAQYRLSGGLLRNQTVSRHFGNQTAHCRYSLKNSLAEPHFRFLKVFSLSSREGRSLL
jgi:hypothetical protein